MIPGLVRRFLRRKEVIYASCTLGTSLMHSVLMFYYVKVYLDHYHLSEEWFRFGQIIYMIWNAINDPLLGYLQDHCQSKVVQTRRHTILYGAPVWALTFLLPWFPLSAFHEYDWLCGVHMVVVLSAYDTMFTHVLLAHGCVLAEMTETHEERVQFYYYHGLAHLLGSSSVLFCEMFSDHLGSFSSFQACCVLIACLAWMFISYTGLRAITKYDLTPIDSQTTKVASSDRATEYSIFQLTWQILTRWNFFWFVLVNFVGEFHYHFVSSTYRIISALLVASELSPSQWNIYCGAIMTLPRVVQLLLCPILPRVGYYKAYQALFILIIISSILVRLVGFSTWTFVAYTLMDSILAGTASSLMGLPLSDIIDEDMKHHKRSHPISSMVFGTNALVTKSANSLGPMLGVYVLNQYGYNEYQDSTLSGPGLSDLRSVMFTLCHTLPLCVGLAQALMWKLYTIKNPQKNRQTSKSYVEHNV